MFAKIVVCTKNIFIVKKINRIRLLEFLILNECQHSLKQLIGFLQFISSSNACVCERGEFRNT